MLTSTWSEVREKLHLGEANLLGGPSLGAPVDKGLSQTRYPAHLGGSGGPGGNCGIPFLLWLLDKALQSRSAPALAGCLLLSIRAVAPVLQTATGPRVSINETHHASAFE